MCSVTPPKFFTISCEAAASIVVGTGCVIVPAAVVAVHSTKLVDKAKTFQATTELNMLQIVSTLGLLHRSAATGFEPPFRTGPQAGQGGPAMCRCRPQKEATAPYQGDVSPFGKLGGTEEPSSALWPSFTLPCAVIRCCCELCWSRHLFLDSALTGAACHCAAILTAAKSGSCTSRLPPGRSSETFAISS